VQQACRLLLNQSMLGLLRRDRNELPRRHDEDEPNFFVALAVGLIYVFRTAAGARIMRELEVAVRKYAADPAALWKLVRSAEPPPPDKPIIDTTAETITPPLPRRER
jgi:hypothetical protein